MTDPAPDNIVPLEPAGTDAREPATEGQLIEFLPLDDPNHPRNNDPVNGTAPEADAGLEPGSVGPPEPIGLLPRYDKAWIGTVLGVIRRNRRVYLGPKLIKLLREEFKEAEETAQCRLMCLIRACEMAYGDHGPVFVDLLTQQPDQDRSRIVRPWQR